MLCSRICRSRSARRWRRSSEGSRWISRARRIWSRDTTGTRMQQGVIKLAAPYDYSNGDRVQKRNCAVDIISFLHQELIRERVPIRENSHVKPYINTIESDMRTLNSLFENIDEPPVHIADFQEEMEKDDDYEGATSTEMNVRNVYRFMGFNKTVDMPSMSTSEEIPRRRISCMCSPLHATGLFLDLANQAKRRLYARNHRQEVIVRHMPEWVGYFLALVELKNGLIDTAAGLAKELGLHLPPPSVRTAWGPLGYDSEAVTSPLVVERTLLDPARRSNLIQTIPVDPRMFKPVPAAARKTGRVKTPKASSAAAIRKRIPAKNPKITFQRMPEATPDIPITQMAVPSCSAWPDAGEGANSMADAMSGLSFGLGTLDVAANLGPPVTPTTIFTQTPERMGAFGPSSQSQLYVGSLELDCFNTSIAHADCL
ncbi:hypothetical protein J8273_2267 [Carpediemonas membranifera]|uniref:Uncharacterized protein n=1 Tax=Carpediemonas membranifera TaxID=201153 RepID=A0A8J6E3H0_9EUKA|nr:hypothetical protein J8273_2267 [Carpediemonas membranifera]|eukprot:KAG9395918.1 hypothetical protein J8273_2267 [Carpediemonas membranifera]